MKNKSENPAVTFKISDVEEIKIIGSALQSTVDKGEDDEENAEYAAAVDGIESLLLALSCAGVDMSSKEFKDAVGVAFETIANEFT